MSKNIYKHLNKRLTTEEFIDRAKKVHGDRYDYSKVVYKNASTPVLIICPIHGEFKQIPDNHLRGHGCKRCFSKPKLSTKNFIERAKRVHGSKYDYSKVIYQNWHTKVVIICPKHGEFEQKAGNHIGKQQQGCPVCGDMNFHGVGTDHSKSKKKGILYLLTCKLGNDYFYKIGITKNTINVRYCGGNKPFEIIDSKEIHGTVGKLYKMEQKILKELKNFRYIPKIKFAGWTECLQITTSNYLKILITKQGHN